MRTKSSTMVWRATRAWGLALILFAVLATACGGGGGSTDSSTGNAADRSATVHPPDWYLQGCTFTVNGKVPSDSPQGQSPGYRSFSPDQSAASAIASIRKNGGSGVWDSFILGSGTELYAGPDDSQRSVATVATGTEILAAEPVLWTASGGKQWLAFFVACGGDHLYWASVPQANAQFPGITATIARDLAAPRSYSGPYPVHPSVQPVVVKGHQLEWKKPIDVYVGRGMVFSGA